MRSILLCTLTLLCTFTYGQEKNKSKKNKKQAAETVKESVKKDEPVTIDAEVVFEEPVEMVSIPNRAMVTKDKTPFFLYENYASKNLSVVYKMAQNDRRLYAFMETSTGNFLTPFLFESYSSYFGRSEYAVVTVNGKYGVVNAKGEVILPCFYDKLNNFTLDDQNYFIASQNGKMGIVNFLNEAIVPFDYEYLSKPYSIPYLVAKKEKKYGLIHPASRQTVIPFEYDELDTYNQHYLKVKKNNTYNLLDISGKPVFTKWYSHLTFYDDNTILAKYNGKDGVIDISEKIRIPFEYERLEKLYIAGSATPFQVQKDGKYGIIRIDGTTFLPTVYDNIRSLSSGLIMLTKGNLKGIINSNGETLLPIEYDDLENYDRLVVARKGNVYSFFDREGKPVDKVTYDFVDRIEVEGYGSSHYLASRSGKKGILDSNAKEVLAFEYESIQPSVAGRYGGRGTFKSPFICIKNGKAGMVGTANKVIVPFEYDEIQYLNSFLFIARKNGKYGVREIYNNTEVLSFDYLFLTQKEGTLVGYKTKFEKFFVSGNKLTLASQE